MALSINAKSEAVADGRAKVEQFVQLLNPVTNVLISGGAIGVDTWAADAARAMGMRVIEIRPNYNKFGRGAPKKRNTEIVLAAHDVVAFWDGASRGTLDTIRKAHEYLKPYVLFNPFGDVEVATDEGTYAAERERLGR